MRICLSHWDRMRTAVEARGLRRFTAGSNEELVGRVVRELEAHEEGTKPPLADWDPLMAMNWNFHSRVMERIGLEIMADRVEGDGMPENRDPEGFNHVCPLCVVRRDFDEHNTPTGRCGVASCLIKVKPGDEAWDEGWITGCADSMLEYAVENNLIVKH